MKEGHHTYPEVLDEVNGMESLIMGSHQESFLLSGIVMTGREREEQAEDEDLHAFAQQMTGTNPAIKEDLCHTAEL
jgi:hypothetical protein